MRNLLLAMLVAFGTTVAVPANACCVQQKDAHKGVTTGIAGTTKAAPQHPQMNKNVTTGSATGTTKGAPSATSGDLAAKYRAMTDPTAGTGPG